MKTYSRMTKIIEGMLIVNSGIKLLFRKYQQGQQAKVDRYFHMYIKDHADLERYNRSMLYYASAT